MQTSSPSYLLLGSLDGARATLAARNAAAVDTQGQRFQADVQALHRTVLVSRPHRFRETPAYILLICLCVDIECRSGHSRRQCHILVIVLCRKAANKQSGGSSAHRPSQVGHQSSVQRLNDHVWFGCRCQARQDCTFWTLTPSTARLRS